MRAILLALTMLLLAGCKTQQRIVTVTDHKSDTVLVTQVARDSVWMLDSVFVREYALHDTIYVETTRWRTKSVERVRTDTVYKSRVDSVRAASVTVKHGGASLWRLFASGIVVSLMLAGAGFCLYVAKSIKR